MGNLEPLTKKSQTRYVKVDEYSPAGSLRTKRFGVVSEQRKTRNDEELDFRFWPWGRWTRAKK